MMKNIISSPYRKMKILLILPVFAIVLYAFAKPDYKYKSADESLANYGQVAAFQAKEVKGTVIQQDGTALPGAAIILKGTTTGTVADANGSFSFGNVPGDGLLVFSFVGFKSKVMKPVFTSEMTVTMVRDTVKYLNLNMSTPPPPPPPPPMNEIKGKSIVDPQPSPLPAINEIEENSSVAPPPPPPPPVAGDQKTGKQPVGVAVQPKPDKEKDVFVVVEGLPEFAGGTDAMKAWITANLKYPAEAVKSKITGKVLVNFMVTTKGKIENVTVIKSISPVLDAEAKRVISSMPDWKPGMQGGKNVPVEMQVPVEFKLK
jgi:TonB family protein